MALSSPNKSHCILCFDVLLANLQRDTISIGDFDDLKLRESSAPLFVTWRCKPKSCKAFESHQLRLRGCIGSFSHVSIPKGLCEYAIKSAFEDGRFQPISAVEVPDLSVTVAVLHSFEQCSKNLHDWTIGVHGIKIFYAEKYQATFLPEVAVEQSKFNSAIEYLFLKLLTGFCRLDKRKNYH